MTFFTNPKWRFAVDAAELVSALGVFVAGVVKTIDFLKDARHTLPVKVITVTIVLIGIFAVYKKLGDELKAAKSKLRTEALLHSTQTEAERLNMHSPDRIIPSKKFVDKTIDTMVKEATEWSADAEKGSSNLYIDVGEKVEFSFQLYYVSDWKRLRRAGYVNSTHGTSVNYDDIPSFFRPSAEKTFNKQFPNWRKAVLRCLESLQETLPKKYRINIQEGVPLNISFEYKSGQVTKNIRFEFDGKKITNTATGSRYAILD